MQQENERESPDESTFGRPEEISSVDSGRHPQQRTPAYYLNRYQSPGAEAKNEGGHCGERIHAEGLRGS